MLFESGDVRNEECVKRQFKNNNYEIEYTGSKSGKCLICFSGNGLYFPNTMETFEKRIMKDDRFEWKNITRSKYVQKTYQKIIYVRDIFKCWYLLGINEEISDIEKVRIFLEKETKRYEIYTLGNSAGGFAAVLFGCLLKAEVVFDFSGQFYLDITKDQVLSKLEKTYEKYFGLKEIVSKSRCKIFFFVPDKAESDLKNYEYIKECKNIYAFFIKSRFHGTTIAGVNYQYILKRTKEEMIRLHKKCHDKSVGRYPFLFLSAGILQGTKAFFGMILYRRKHKEPMGL